MYARIGAALSISSSSRCVDRLAAGAGANLVSSSPAEASMTQRATQLATRLDEHIYPTLTEPQVARIVEQFEAQVG